MSFPESNLASVIVYVPRLKRKDSFLLNTYWAPVTPKGQHSLSVPPPQSESDSKTMQSWSVAH